MNNYTKYFTPIEANKSLPLVKKIVEDILSNAKEIKLLSRDYQGEIEKYPSFNKLLSDINLFIKELDEIGCYFKDINFTIGLVDFPSIIDDREVYLCWRSDEEEILYYHEINDGYLGRKLIPSQFLHN
jgi:hypothetical protein